MGVIKNKPVISDRALTRERMVYLMEMRSLGYVPNIMDFMDYVPIGQIEKDWDTFMKSSLAHKLRSIGLHQNEVQTILFDTFCDEYLAKDNNKR